MKVALIQCPVWGTYDPPLALVQLPACLKKEGHEVFVFDINIKLYLNRTENYKNMWAWEQCLFWYDPTKVSKFFNDNQDVIDRYVEQIIGTDARIVCFSVASSSWISSLELAKMIKRKRHDVIIVFGGSLFFQREWIASILNNESVDIVAVGEGELTLCELVNLLEKNKDISLCRGIIFKKNGQIIDCRERPLIKNLDSLPLLDFTDLPLDNYDDSVHIPLMTSRGCVQHCVFCSSRAFWRGYRVMSGERIYQEIKFHADRNGRISHVDFMDLLFNGSMKTVITFCDLMINDSLGDKIKWAANAIVRPEMTPEVLKKMSKAGCEHLIYGIESGSQRVLDMMRKRYRISDAVEVIKATHNAGIMVTANFMFGFPGEAEADFNQTLDFVKRNAKYLDRVYPSRTYCAVEEFSYFHEHLEEFDIKPNPPNHLYWETIDGKNTYPERLRRCEEYCKLASSLGIEVGCGVQTSVELDRWYNLGHYYEWKKDYENALDCSLKYYELDSENEVISNKVKFYYSKLEENNSMITRPNLLSRLKNAIGQIQPRILLKESGLLKQDNKNQVRFSWNIHYDCNYRCSYCFFEGKWNEYKKRNIYLHPEEWMKYWRRVYAKYGRCYILITGGEPFTYPDFIKLVSKLSQIHYPINISSNASRDLESFVRHIDPERVYLSVSFQPEFEKLENFLEKAKFLRRNKFDGCINFVAYPPFLKGIKYYVDKFKSVGEDLKIIPFWGKYNGKEYPYGYTQHEKEIIGIKDDWFNKVRKKGSLCPTGQRSALIFPDGKVARCGQIGERMLIGNFFDPEFRLLDGPLPCDAEACPCDEDVTWPEEEQLKRNNYVSSVEISTETAKVDLIKERTKNSLLNDNEYNSKKTVLNSSPKAIFIQAAGPCNSYCAFCSRGSDYEIFNLEVHRRCFEDKLYPFISKAEQLIFTGSGEFLLLPEAEKILDFFDSRFPHIEKMFSTNGSTLTPNMCEKIVNSESKYTIHISLHASNGRLHKVLTRTDHFHRVIGQLSYLLKLREKKGNPEVRLIFVATTLNIEDLPNFIRFASQLGVDKVICYYNYIYIPTQKYLSCFFKQELTNRMFDEAEELVKRLNIEVDLPPKFGQKEYSNLGICREPWSQIMFTTQGHVLPCDASEDCHENLENKEFMDVWDGEYYQNLRKALIDGRASCFKHCFRANPLSVNDFRSHVIHRGERKDIDILWGDNF